MKRKCDELKLCNVRGFGASTLGNFRYIFHFGAFVLLIPEALCNGPIANTSCIPIAALLEIAGRP